VSLDETDVMALWAPPDPADRQGRRADQENRVKWAWPVREGNAVSLVNVGLRGLKVYPVQQGRRGQQVLRVARRERTCFWG